MKTKKVIGTFDCRVFKKGIPKAARAMAEAGNRIILSVVFEEADLTDEMKEFAHLHEKSGKYYINIKVYPKNCRIYTASAKQIDFPDYKKIDGGRFEVVVDYVIKHGTEGTTELNGLYANAIQIIKRADIPFEPVAGASDDFLAGNAPDPFGEDDDNKTDLPFN
jgi:hypothetical protein